MHKSTKAKVWEALHYTNGYHPLGTRSHIYTVPSSCNTALCARFTPLPLGRSESSWLHKSFGRSVLVTSYNNLLLGKALPCISPDSVDLHLQDYVHIARLRYRQYLVLRWYENRLQLELGSQCRWCGDDPETVSHIFQEYPRLARKRVEFEVSNPRGLWSKTKMTLRFLNSLASFRVSMRGGLQGFPVQ